MDGTSNSRDPKNGKAAATGAQPRRASLRRVAAWLLSLALVGSGVSLGLGLQEPAQAATVTFGQVSAQVSDHLGQNFGTTGNCIRYSPTNGANPNTGFVTSPGEALTAHGFNPTCPTNLDKTTQSAVGVVPTNVTSVNDGVPFLLGTTTHYNNPVENADDHYTGKMTFKLAGVTSANTFSWDWSIWETPNVQATCPAEWWAGTGDCLDRIVFTASVSQQIVTINNVQYRAVVDGFRAPAGGSCPAAPSGGTGDEFMTHEGTNTTACIYATLAQVRSLNIVKKVVAPAGVTVPATAFNFSSTSNTTGSPWEGDSFALTSSSSTSGSLQQELLQTESLTVTEAAPGPAGNDNWALTDISCVDGAGAPVPEATSNLNARRLTLTNVQSPATTAAAPITCTFTNTYSPKGTLTLVKNVNNATGGAATPADFTLTATGPSTISGPGNTAAVTNQRVATGTYTLTETGPAGYAGQGWVCTGGGAGNTGAGGSVSVADDQNITCTISNRFQTGNFTIKKVVADPANGFVGTSATQFTGTYNCGSGAVPFAVSTGTAFTSPAIPVGRNCTVNETQPSGNLKNSSYSWGAPSYSGNPVTIGDGTNPTVTVTNTITQATGAIAISKVVAPRAGTPASGYTGGNARAFPVTYNCELPAGTSVGSGSLSITPGTPATVGGIAAGAACSFTETLNNQSGDFIDASYDWDTHSFSPATITVAANQTTGTTVTNTFVRNFSDLVLRKVVQGDGYVGTGTPFEVTYDCGNNPITVDLAAGGSRTVQVPANTNCTVVEAAPGANLLSPAFEWGPPSYTGLTNGTVAVPVNGSKTVTITNPTVPVYAKLSVTKMIAPTSLAAAVESGTTFPINVACNAPASGAAGNYQHTFTVAAGGSDTTPDLPVGTECTVTETAPAGSAGLVDDSYAWDGAPAPQTVTVTPKNTTVPVTVTNRIKRAYGNLNVTKAVAALNGVNGAGTTFSGTWSCTYGSDAPVTGTWSRTGPGAASVTGPNDAILLGSTCTITEGTPSPATPSSTDASYLWGAETITPATIKLTKAAPTASFTVTNPIRRVTGSFGVGKVVNGGAAGTAYVDQPFTFDWSCTPADGGAALTGTLSARSGQSAILPAGTEIPAGSRCTVTENANPAPIDPFRWDTGVTFTVTGATGTPSGRTVAFTTPADGAPVGVQVTNTISRRTVEVAVAKRVVDPDGGFTGTATTDFQVSLTCAGNTYGPQGVKAGAQSTFTVPLGVNCSASEAPIPAGAGLADDSFTWAPTPTITPASVTAAEGTTPVITVTNTVERVRTSIDLTKVLDENGYSGVVSATRTYSGTWTCSYAGQEVGGSWSVDGPGAATLTGPSASVLLTSRCTATENPLTAPSSDPSYSWAPVGFEAIDVTAAGPNTLKVTNKLTRSTGELLVTKKVTGQTGGYNRSTADFTVAYHCYLASALVGPFYDGEVQVVAGATAVSLAQGIPLGWTCAVRETAPAANLLKDSSYSWGPAEITINGATTDTVEVTSSAATVAVNNPIRRVTGDWNLRKQYGPSVSAGVVNAGTEFSGTYTCTYDAGKATEETFSGTWRVTGTGTATLNPDPALPLGTVCQASENAPADTDLVDTSWTWAAPQVGAPVTVQTEAPTLQVTNNVTRVYSDLSVAKVYAGPAAALPAGTTVSGAWTCTYQGNVVGQGRWELPATGGEVKVVRAADRIPAESVCTVSEDTLNNADLTDASYAWATPSVAPAGGVVTLRPTGGQKVTITNDVTRVRGNLEIRKDIAGGQPLDTGLRFTGTWSCTYGTDAPVSGTWSITDEGSWNTAGLLVGSVCTATEDTARPAPVAGDPSYVWQAPVIDPAQASVQANTPAALTVTNTAARVTGSFQITKALAGATAGEPTGQRYTFDYSCVAGNGNVVSGTSTPIAAGGLWDAPQVPIGSKCTVTEQPLPDPLDPSYTWQEPIYSVTGVGENGATNADGSVQFTLPSGQVAVVVTATNTLDRATRQVRVTKTLSGATDGYVDGTFAVDVTCQPVTGPGLSANLTIKPGTPGSLDGVPVGSTCGVTEQPARPDLADPSYRWGTPNISPSGPVLVEAGQGPVTINVDNPISRQFGTFSVTKQVRGTGASTAPANGYRFDFSCLRPGNATPATGSMTVPLTGTIGYDGPALPQGSVCTLSEPADSMPDPGRGAAWQGVEWTVDGDSAGADRSTEVVIGADTSVAVVATNVLKRTPGSYQVTKTSDPVSGSMVSPGDVITWTVTVTPDGKNPVADVVVTDDLSQVTPWATAQGVPQVSQGTAVLDGNRLVWTVGTVDGTEPVTLTYKYRVKADAVGVQLRNVVTATGEEPPTSCDPCETTHETAGDWELVKTSDPASGSQVKPGDTITYTLTATSLSRETALRNLTISDDLSQVVAHSVLQDLSDPSVGALKREGNELIWTIDTLPAGSVATLTYSVVVNADAWDVTLRNVVTGRSPDSPPASCPVPMETARRQAKADVDPKCGTKHTTPPKTKVIEQPGKTPTPTPSTPPPPPGTGPRLPSTGAPVGVLWYVASGLALLVFGSHLVYRGRRRQRH